jgi:hypothetical protein
MATSTRRMRLSRTTPAGAAAVPAAYALGALLLAGEAVVHVQQFAVEFHGVRWIGPLFLANAVTSLVVIVALVYPRVRELAAATGVAISALALGSLAVSYGTGLFGWQETGFRTPIALAVIFEVGAVILLSMALALGAIARGTAR